MFNRFPAKCQICGAWLEAGQGVVALNPDGKPKWVTKCNKHIDWRQVKKQWRPVEYKEVDT